MNYVNGFKLSVQEVAILEFTINTQQENKTIVSVVMMYEALKQIHERMGAVIQEHDDKLAKIANDRAKAN